MLEQPMIEKLLSMRLQGMADGLKAQEQDSGIREPPLETLSCVKDPPKIAIQAARARGVTTA